MSVIFLSIISVAATLASIGLLFSPLVAVHGMIKCRSVGVMTITFFCAQYMNCVVWSMYGILQKAWAVILCNTPGTIVATVCMLNFLAIIRLQERKGQHATSTTYKESLIRAISVVVFCFILMCVITSLNYWIGHELASSVNGAAAGCCSVIMLSSPLGMAKDIIRKRNAEGLQPVMLSFGTVNCILWTLYGLLNSDAFIYVPNALCTLACFFQIFLLFRYGRRPSSQNYFDAVAEEVPFTEDNPMMV